jgi:two-component system chemotaxis sensor kinase CheA
MQDSDPTPFDPAFLDDFYSECEEHLVLIRNSLSALEPQLAGAEVDSSVIEKLYRSYHTLKGISGIVGLKDAELLAHGTEDYLRALTRLQTKLSEEGLLMDSVQKFEQIVAAHRAKGPLPQVNSLLEELAKLSGKNVITEPVAAPTLDTPTMDLEGRIRVAVQEGKTIWCCTFAPNSALDQRGVNINEIRRRLMEAGEILQATPDVQPGGIVFRFIVAVREVPIDWEEAATVGLKVEPYGERKSVTAEEIDADVSGITESVAPHNPFLAPSHIVRVDLGRLDELMRIAGEMVVHRARFEENIDRVVTNHPGVDCTGLQEQSLSLGRQLRDLRDAIMRVRLVRVAELFDRMPYVVRDLAREAGKKVRISVHGQQTEIDKYVVERLKDPFLHLIRNCVSHGISTPEARIAGGKPPEATITLSAATAGDSVLIKVEDDGEGIDPAKVVKRAEKLGVHVPSTLDNVTLLELISTPGFSTREEADMASGRGVGMAVVVETVRELGGTLSLETNVGHGTKFTLRLPLTLAIADALVISAGGQTFAVPQSSVDEIVQMQSSDVQQTEFAQLMLHRGKALPLLCVATRFGLKLSKRASYPIVVVGTERGPVGFIVDRVMSQREVVVRSMRDPLVQVPGVSGATELGDGKPVLIIDPVALVNHSGHGEPNRRN